MILTPEQQAILSGSKGETLAKVMKTLVMYGETFGADKLVPVTSEYNHLVTSFGLKMMKPIFDLMQQLIDAGAIKEMDRILADFYKVLQPEQMDTEWTVFLTDDLYRRGETYEIMLVASDDWGRTSEPVIYTYTP